MIRWDKLVLAQSNEVYEDKTSVAILREGRVRNGLESKRKASCYCSKKTKPKIEGRILKLGGFVMLGLVVITITPGDSVAKSRLFGAVLAAAAIALMMFVVALFTSVERMNWELVEAARDLGAGAWQTFRHGIIPQIRAGLLAGAALVFLPATGQFVIPDLLGGAKTVLLGNLLQQQFGASRDWPFGAAIATVTMAIVLFGLWIQARLMRRSL